MTALGRMQRARHAVGRSAGVFLRDVGQGLLEVSHNTLALLGLLVLGIGVFAVAFPLLTRGLDALYVLVVSADSPASQTVRRIAERSASMKFARSFTNRSLTCRKKSAFASAGHEPYCSVRGD